MNEKKIRGIEKMVDNLDVDLTYKSLQPKKIDTPKIAPQKKKSGYKYLAIFLVSFLLISGFSYIVLGFIYNEGQKDGVEIGECNNVWRSYVNLILPEENEFQYVFQSNDKYIILKNMSYYEWVYLCHTELSPIISMAWITIGGKPVEYHFVNNWVIEKI